jgi:flagellar basal-body rod protein FlgF
MPEEFSPAIQVGANSNPLSIGIEQPSPTGIFIATHQLERSELMKLGASQAVLGSLQQEKRLDIIANNIANVNSPGFKKDNIHFSTVLGEVSYTNLDQGPIRETGNKLDIALSGSGFLKVKTDQGTYYTRAGNLTLDSKKNLVTQDGNPILGKNGPITINNASTVRILDDGQVFDDKDAVDNLDVVEFPSNVVMKKVRNGLFEPDTPGASPTTAANCTVRQGSLEGANFNIVEEMVKMVETTRSFETYQKTLQTLDRDLDGQLIAKLTS